MYRESANPQPHASCAHGQVRLVFDGFHWREGKQNHLAVVIAILIIVSFNCCVVPAPPPCSILGYATLAWRTRGLRAPSAEAASPPLSGARPVQTRPARWRNVGFNEANDMGREAFQPEKLTTDWHCLLLVAVHLLASMANDRPSGVVSTPYICFDPPTIEKETKALMNGVISRRQDSREQQFGSSIWGPKEPSCRWFR